IHVIGGVRQFTKAGVAVTDQLRELLMVIQGVFVERDHTETSSFLQQKSHDLVLAEPDRSMLVEPTLLDDVMISLRFHRSLPRLAEGLAEALEGYTGVKRRS